MDATIPIFQVDAFADRVFAGNPAAVCPLEAWLPDPVLQAIAAENNLSETAFLVGGDGRYELRWFTPACEVDLCGHATLAASHCVFEHLEPGRGSVVYDSRSGPLEVVREGSRLRLDFPAAAPRPSPHAARLRELFGARVREALEASATGYALVALPAEADVRAAAPDLAAVAELPHAGVVVTAPGDAVDFVSRFFAPRVGVPEDPVTGSAHCLLTPYWAERLGRVELRARQVSARGGELACALRGDRVHLSGTAVLYLRGEIHVPTALPAGAGGPRPLSGGRA